MAERCREVLSRDEIAQEVFAAYIEGRIHRGKPEWLNMPPSDKYRERPAMFAWTPDRERIYVTSTGEGGRFTVMSVLVEAPDSPLRHGLLRWWRAHRNGHGRNP